MPRKLEPNETVATVWPRLTNPREYVSGALQKMRQCNNSLGSSSIRIGITGTGQKPYYRVFRPATDGQDEVIFGSFYDMHDPLENGFVDTDNWSVASMTFDELLNFYADQIGFQGIRR